MQKLSSLEYLKLSKAQAFFYNLRLFFCAIPLWLKNLGLKLVTLYDVDEINSTLDYIAEHWGDYDMSGAVPPSLSHDI
mgnify:CR=1 FL=1